MEEIMKYNETIFEDIKHINEYGNEYWCARELQKVLDYKELRKFENVIFKAQNACRNSSTRVVDHFVEVDKMVNIGSGAQRKQNDYKLSRYACYLIVQNADPNKAVVALGQTYFAIQTRKQELTEKEANEVHYEVGSKIRNTIKELGGTMPEELPTPKKSLKELEKENKNIYLK